MDTILAIRGRETYLEVSPLEAAWRAWLKAHLEI
jgi:hypothetical protein